MTIVTSEPTLTAADSLKILVSAAGDSLCAVHEVGPVANHISGPLSALRPFGHPEHGENKAGLRRAKATVDRLITDATSRDTIECTCEGQFRHPLAVVVPNISDGAFIRPHHNSIDADRHLDRAIKSADVDLLTYHCEPRLEALKIMVDRARAEHGGTLPDPVATAATTIVHSLAGRTRWNVRDGYHEGWSWSHYWRGGAIFEKADGFMKHDVVQQVVLRRVVKGS